MYQSRYVHMYAYQSKYTRFNRGTQIWIEVTDQPSRRNYHTRVSVKSHVSAVWLNPNTKLLQGVQQRSRIVHEDMSIVTWLTFPLYFVGGSGWWFRVLFVEHHVRISNAAQDAEKMENEYWKQEIHESKNRSFQGHTKYSFSRRGCNVTKALIATSRAISVEISRNTKIKLFPTFLV